MIVEHAILDVDPAQTAAFEAALTTALPLMTATPGFIAMEVRPCVGRSGRYLLLVTWQSLEDHRQGFRQSDRYQQWRSLLHHFYNPFPLVEHFGEAIVQR